MAENNLAFIYFFRLKELRSHRRQEINCLGENIGKDYCKKNILARKKRFDGLDV